MGRTFQRLEKQVSGRRIGATRQLSWSSRIRNTEVFLLELGSYIQLHVATDPDDASDANIVASYTEFKKALEGTV